MCRRKPELKRASRVRAAAFGSVLDCLANAFEECAPILPGSKPVLPMEKPNKGLEVVARALRRFLFAILILLGLAFAVVCYAELLGLVQFD
jgi:hypothetical protein